ncbi:MAG: adenylate/guanylate cyclase domain-containing protein [Alphaproteobacteria bacterium]|nr:adenylate/guanylate cyclase domain-containing protein [Alphaproteobacteria bacterium]
MKLNLLKNLSRVFHYVVPAAVLVAVLAFKLYAPVAEELTLRVFDTFQRLNPRIYEAAPVRLLDIDDESLDRVGQWPWPRTFLAYMVRRLTELGASAVIFDVVFAEGDRTSPANILPIWNSTPEIDSLKEKVAELPDHDREFAAAIREAGNVITGFVLTQGTVKRTPTRKGSYAVAGDDPRPHLPAYTGAVVNLPDLEAAGAGNGSFNLVAEVDGLIRRVPMFVLLGDSLQLVRGGSADQGIYPTLPMEALRVAQGAKTYILKSAGASGEGAFGEKTGLNNIRVGRIEVPTDSSGRIWIHDTGTIKKRYVPAWKIFDDKEPIADEIANNIIIVGTSAAGLLDLRATPLAAVVPGAEVHVQAIEQMLLSHYLERPDWADGAEPLYIVVLGALLIALIPHLGAMWTGIIGMGATVLAGGGSWLLFVEQRMLLDPVMPIIATLLVYMASSAMNYLRTESEKKVVRAAFSRYMSPALVEQLAEDPSRLVLGGEMRDMTLLFADIRGFTSISEQFKGDPQGLTRLINRFLTPMSDMILARQGTIDKYMGDAIMAFWNAPLDDAKHAANACGTALAMFMALQAVNDKLKAEAEAEGAKFFTLKLGIGLNSGLVCVGNMGSDQRFDYSVLGDAVNLASRLEGQSKTYGVGIVIGEETQKRAPDYATLELDLIAVKGKKEAVRIFTVVGAPSLRNDPKFKQWADEHDNMLAAYRRQDWAEARRHLESCRLLDGAIGDFYDIYADRITDFEANPPGPNWDGVYVATSK